MDTILNKLTKQGQSTPTIIFSDIDGTVFTPDLRILLAPFYNLQTKKILEKYSIPFVLSTGRIFWNTLYDTEMTLHGLPKPDAVIVGAGTEIWYRNEQDILEKDNHWLRDIEPLGNKNLSDFEKYNIYFKQKTSHLIVGFINNITMKLLEEIIQDLKKRYDKNTKIFYGESLVHKNTTEIFSGNIFIGHADKGDALKYILGKIDQSLDVFVFGDAIIDFPMFLVPSSKKYAIKPFLVYATALAKKCAEKYEVITIINNQGPQAILKLMQNQFNRKFSIAQNSPFRRFVYFFEPLLNSIMNKNLTANDISFLGLTYILKGIDLLQNKNILKKLKGYYLYIWGNFTDILDGIRARSELQNTNIPGQLVDVFCDRIKEFYQLYSRGQHRFQENKERGYETFLASISCILPSLARAQAEMQGSVVKEKDEKGGSMLDRTILLFQSLLFFAINNDKKSFAIDKRMYEQNIATYQNRICLCHSERSEEYILRFTQDDIHKQTQLQHNALERFLLLVQLFQEEYDSITKFLKQDQTVNSRFKKSIQEYHKYLGINVVTARKRFGFKTYDLLSFKKNITLKI